MKSSWSLMWWTYRFRYFRKTGISALQVGASAGVLINIYSLRLNVLRFYLNKLARFLILSLN